MFFGMADSVNKEISELRVHVSRKRQTHYLKEHQRIVERVIAGGSPRFAIFHDFRGVLYCEPVNEFMQIWERIRPAIPEQRNWRGKVIQKARPERCDHQVIFFPPKYTKDNNDQIEKGHNKPWRGYHYQPKKVYLEENFWGPVDVLKFIEDHEAGFRLQKAFWTLTPEGNRMISAFDTSGLNQRNSETGPVVSYVPIYRRLGLAGDEICRLHAEFKANRNRHREMFARCQQREREERLEQINEEIAA